MRVNDERNVVYRPLRCESAWRVGGFLFRNIRVSSVTTRAIQIRTRCFTDYRRLHTGDCL